jgi:glycosyltransferase involved in cell wall biosynthesis
MSMGLPVVASDIAVHREICQQCAVYFSALDFSALADRAFRLNALDEAKARMAIAGRERASNFSWERHLNQVLACAEHLCGARV